MSKNIRRGATRLALLPVVAAGGPLATIMLPAVPAAATSQSPTPSLPTATGTLSAASFIVDVAVTGANRLDVLTDPNSVTRIEGDAVTLIEFESDISTIDSGPGGQLHGFVETHDGGQLVTISDDGTLTAVGDPVSLTSSFEDPATSLRFDANGTATVTFAFHRSLGERRTDRVRMTEDGGWEHVDVSPVDDKVVGSVRSQTARRSITT